MTETDTTINPATTDTTKTLPAELTDKIRALRDGLLDGLVERDVAIRLALLAPLAGEHLLMVGPPGTAKSLVATRLNNAFKDSPYFERLLTRFTVPEELFGPLSIKGLEEDRYERLTAKYLPTASIAFLDEIFKANSAILNSLLTLLNERVFDNGVERQKTPLLAVIGASNELPEGEELDALFDRFLLRLHVGPVSKKGFGDLLKLRGNGTPSIAAELKLTKEDIAAIQEVAESVDVPTDVSALLRELRDWCIAEGIQVSDRRWRKVVKLLQVSAATNGRSSVSLWDCWLLQHCLWDAPEAREKVFEWYATRVGSSQAMNPERLTAMVTAWEQQLKRDKTARSQSTDENGKPLFVGADGKNTTKTTGNVPQTRDDEPLYLAPDNALDRHHNHIKDRKNNGKGYTRAELDELKVAYNHNWRQFADWNGRDAYLANESSRLIGESSLPPALEPTRQKRAYVVDCARQVSEIADSIRRHDEDLNAHIATFQDTIASHLWITPEFAETASKNLRATQIQVETLAVKVARVLSGFDSLPVEELVPLHADAIDDSNTADGDS